MTIKDIIRIAREITDCCDAITDRNAVVSLYDPWRIDAAGEAMLYELANGPVGTLRLASVDCVQKKTAEKIGRTPRSFAVDCANTRNALYGYVEDSVVPIIKYRAGLNICWERFILTKELLHLYSGTANDTIAHPADLIVKAARDSREVIASENTELDDETSAFYMAIETLIPWKLRGQFHALRKAGATDYQIARSFMIPVPFVQHFIGEREGESYVAMSDRLNKEVD